MSLHGLLSVTIGVPNVEETAAYYADFGLAPQDDGWFSTLDAGRQLRLVSAPTRRLISLRVGADDADDLARAAASLALHHTSWQVDDVDDVGRGACAGGRATTERPVAIVG